MFLNYKFQMFARKASESLDFRVSTIIYGALIPGVTLCPRVSGYVVLGVTPLYPNHPHVIELQSLNVCQKGH